MNGTILDFLAYVSVILFLIITMGLGVIGFFWLCRVFMKTFLFFAESDGTGIVHDEPDIGDQPSSFDKLAGAAAMVAMNDRDIYYMSEVGRLCESGRPLHKEELEEALIRDDSMIRWHDLAHEDYLDEIDY